MSGQRRSEVIAEDQMEELRSVFNEIDTDGNGKIKVSELQTALELCDVKLPGYEVRKLVTKYDYDSDGCISMDEFRMLYQHLKEEKDFGRKFKTQVKTRTGVETHGGTSQASVEGTTHTVGIEERNAFTEWLNRNLADDPDCKNRIPIEANNLYKQCNDGILLCKLINKSAPDTIDERAINKGKLSVFTKQENLTLALQSSQAIGCNVVNIGPDDLMEGKPHLVLGLLWQIIRIGLLSEISLASHPGLVALLEEGETIEDLMKLSPEQILLRWVNYHLRNAGVNRQIRNFGEDIKDSEAYSYLLHQIGRDKGVTLEPLGLRVELDRAECVLQEADKLECRSFVTPHDIVSANTKLNLAFVANLFNNYPALEKPDDVDFEIIEESREEKTYRNWMNSMGVKPFVTYLYNDLRDAAVIFQLYDIIKPGSVDWSKVICKFSKMKQNFEKIENCNYAVALGKDMKFSLVGVGGQDIYDGNATLTLALVWQLMRAYTLALLSKVTTDGKPVVDKQIIEWANETLKEHGKKASIRSFQDPSLNDGRVIIDLVDSVKPGIINYDLVKEGSGEAERLANAKYAISMGRKIGARIYALPEDIVEVKPKMIMTIFTCLMVKDMERKPQDQVQQQD